LRTETTINNTYDFSIGKRLHNLPELREVGFAANRRLLEVERISHDCMLTEDAFQTINAPWRRADKGLRDCVLPTPRPNHFCMPSLSSVSLSMASVAPTCATILPH